MPPRNQPPDYLPAAVRDHPEVIKACHERDIGRLFRLVGNLTEEPERFTNSHLARRCGLGKTRVAEYMDRKRQAISLDVLARIADGLRIPGARFQLAPRPWETTLMLAARYPEPIGGSVAAMPVRDALALPAGRQLVGSFVPAHVGVLESPSPAAWRVFAPRATTTGRSVVIARHPGHSDVHVVLDSGLLRRGPAVVAGDVLDAYTYDALTYGILWAVVGYDAALLDDDADLAVIESISADLRAAANAAWSNDTLSAASRMFTGSRLCAVHVTANLDGDADESLFWTREQRGEEASTWLLFKHKYQYLLDTTAGSAGAPHSDRVFCIPRPAVENSPLYERILMLLAIALMESLGIRTWICPDPDFSDVDGFALLPGRQAVIASWARTQGEPTLELARRAPWLRRLTDTANSAREVSVSAPSASSGRMAASAEYLGIDPLWCGRRCAQLAAAGVAGLARPRSRHLGLDGLEASLRYTAQVFMSKSRREPTTV